MPLDHDEIWDDTALIDAYDKAVKLVKKEIATRCNGDLKDSSASVYSASSSTNNEAKKKPRHKHGKKKKKSWAVGDFCRAVYSEDCRVYEAIIENLDQSRQICEVRFLGYDNTDMVSTQDLLQSKGKRARERQAELSQGFDDEYEQEEEVEIEDTPIGATSLPNNPSGSSNLTKDKSEPTTHNKPSSKKSSFRPPPSWFMPSQNFPPPSFTQSHYGWGFPSSQRTPNPFFNRAPSMPPPPPPPPFIAANSVIDDQDEAMASMLMSWYMSGYHTGYYQGLRHSQIK